MPYTVPLVGVGDALLTPLTVALPMCRASVRHLSRMDDVDKKVTTLLAAGTPCRCSARRLGFLSPGVERR